MVNFVVGKPISVSIRDPFHFVSIRENDITFSLMDTKRPGSLMDTDIGLPTTNPNKNWTYPYFATYNTPHQYVLSRYNSYTVVTT